MVVHHGKIVENFIRTRYRWSRLNSFLVVFFCFKMKCNFLVFYNIYSSLKCKWVLNVFMWFHLRSWLVFHNKQQDLPLSMPQSMSAKRSFLLFLWFYKTNILKTICLILTYRMCVANTCNIFGRCTIFHS